MRTAQSIKTKTGKTSTGKAAGATTDVPPRTETTGAVAGSARRRGVSEEQRAAELIREIRRENRKLDKTLHALIARLS